MRHTYVLLLATLCFGLAGCGDSASDSPDAATAMDGSAADGGPRRDGGGGGPCTRHADCSDDVYCNGEERCDPTDEDADANGCLPVAPPCDLDECDEDADACDSCPTADADSDGADSAACGGMDCDDTNAAIFPGAIEVCDRDGIDEDCDPTTLGPDVDGDGHSSDDCCNLQAGGSLRCGEDCDDTRDSVSPTAVDGCGGGDEDCDGRIDEEPDSVFFRDADNDNYGRDDDSLSACALPTGYAVRGGDCADDPFENDDANEINPGVTEVCDTVDNDCDDSIDEMLTCDCSSPGMEEPCGVDPALNGIGICRLGSHTCRPEGSWTTCVGSTAPRAETCNSMDDDCDGDVDEDSTVRCWQDADRDGYAATGAAQMIACTCPDAYTSRDPATNPDCAPNDATRHPGASEICNRIDEDCSRGAAGDEPLEDQDGDAHTRTGFAACTGGFPKDDCHDGNADVFPGQYRFFTSGFCPSNLCVCGTGCIAPQGPFGAVCPFCPPDVPTSSRVFDYDCSGTSTPQPSQLGDDCYCQLGFSCNGNFPIYSGSPSCGANVTWKRCGNGGCGSCTGTGPDTALPIGCH